MKTLSEKTLEDFARLYEESMGEINAPDFTFASKKYSDKKEIPFYKFDDDSIILVIHDGIKINYECLDSDEFLDEEYDIEWSVNNNQYVILDN